MIRVILVGRLVDRFVEKETKSGMRTAVSRARCDSKYGAEYMTLRVYGQWMIQDVVANFADGDFVVVSGKLRGYGNTEDPRGGRRYEVVCDAIEKAGLAESSGDPMDLFSAVETKPNPPRKDEGQKKQAGAEDDEYDPFA